MQLLLRRDQRSGMLGRVTFTLDVRAEFSEEERQCIERYRLGKTLLYERLKLTDEGARLFGPISGLVLRMMNLTVSIEDLRAGKRLAFTEFDEMLAAEAEIKEACASLKQMMDAAAQFTGEEIIELQ